MNDTARRKREVCRYDFTDQDGRIAFQKIRYAIVSPAPGGRTKDFRYFDPHAFGGIGAMRKPEGADRLIFNLPAILNAIREGETVHSCEGEKDACALIDLGHAATSVHQGANKVTLEQMAWLYDAPRIVIWVDKDPAEKAPIGAHDAIMRAMHLHKLGYPGAIEFKRARGRWGELKDVADHLAAGYTVEQAVTVNPEKLAACAALWTPSTNARAGYAR
ncbi:hypothetical protein OYT00_11235 [Microbacterium paraoxydans]|uniref:hypothetical protein n=1 Tax=Microbacterium paraoxydans TaxID=199592 RepID=UPI0022867542|nr:hypothetical protein [Microbacterium paraoxydans]MCZ0710574.1 hypothetical protein [Microbacterium paraoxydans]